MLILMFKCIFFVVLWRNKNSQFHIQLLFFTFAQSWGRTCHRHTRWHTCSLPYCCSFYSQQQTIFVPGAQGEKGGFRERLPSTQMHTLTSGNRNLTDHLIKITNDLFFFPTSFLHSSEAPPLRPQGSIFKDRRQAFQGQIFQRCLS